MLPSRGWKLEGSFSHLWFLEHNLESAGGQDDDDACPPDPTLYFYYFYLHCVMLAMARFIFKGQEESNHNLLGDRCFRHLWPCQESPGPDPKFQEPPQQELENLLPSKSTGPS